MSDQLISIVLPIYNQADHIAAIIEDYVEVLQRIPYSYELILVVNNSRDASLSICHALSEKYPFVHTLESAQGGWGLAVRMGLQAAQGDLICYTNSARTSPQDLLLLLLYAVANPNVVIKANRKIRDNWQRRLGSLLYNIEVRSLFDLPYWDINGTPKIFPRTFDKLLQLTANDDLIDAEFNVVCNRADYRMLEVPIFSARRHGGRSTTRYSSAIKMYIGAYRLWRQMANKAQPK